MIEDIIRRFGMNSSGSNKEGQEKPDDYSEIIDVVEKTLLAFSINRSELHGQNILLHLGTKRIGRVETYLLDYKGRREQSHIAYFYDLIDPHNPQVRVGLYIQRNNLSLYSTVPDGTPEQFNYSSEISPESALALLEDMPKRPGDLRFRVGNADLIDRLFEGETS